MNKHKNILEKCGRSFYWPWELEWALQHLETNLCCAYVSGNCMLNLNILAFIVPEIRTDRSKSGRLLGPQFFFIIPVAWREKGCNIFVENYV